MTTRRIRATAAGAEVRITSSASVIRRDVVPPVEMQERVRTYVETYGTQRARAILGGVSGETLARVCAGLLVHRGSVALISQAFAARDAAAIARGEDGST